MNWKNKPKQRRMLFSFFISSSLPAIFKFSLLSNEVLMTSQGVFLGIKIQNQEYLWKEWDNALDTWHVYLLTKSSSDGIWFDVALAIVLVPVSFLYNSNLTVFTFQCKYLVLFETYTMPTLHKAPLLNLRKQAMFCSAQGQELSFLHNRGLIPSVLP